MPKTEALTVAFFNKSGRGPDLCPPKTRTIRAPETAIFHSMHCQAPFSPLPIPEPSSFVVPASFVRTLLCSKNYFVRLLFVVNISQIRHLFADKPGLSGQIQPQQSLRVQVNPLPAHGQMQVGAGGAAGASAEGDRLAFSDYISFIYKEF